MGEWIGSWIGGLPLLTGKTPPFIPGGETTSCVTSNSAESYYSIKRNSFPHETGEIHRDGFVNSSRDRLVAEHELEAAGLVTTVHADLFDGAQAEAFQIVVLAQSER